MPPLATRFASALALLSLGLLPFAAAHAGEGRWTLYGPPTANYARLVPDPFASGVVVSVNSGQGPGSRVFKTVDSGRSWSYSGVGLSGDLNVTGLAADPRIRGTFYAASRSAFYRSTDSGAHWSQVSDSSFWPDLQGVAGQLYVAATVRGDATVLLVAGSDKVWRSSDGGRSWTVTALNGVFALGLIADAESGAYLRSFGGTVYRTVDAGRTWSVVWTTPEGNEAGIPEALAVDPRQPSTVLLANEEELYRSTDRGAHWIQVTTLPHDLEPSDVRISAVGFDLRAPRVVYVAHSGTSHNALWVSRDRGATWSDRALPLGNRTTRLWSDARTPELFAASFDTLYLSHDYGATWEVRMKVGGLPSVRPPALPILHQAEGPSARRWYRIGGLLYTSLDAGASWRYVPIQIAGSDAFLLDLANDPNHFDTLYAGTNLGVLKSPDLGATWSRLDSPLSDPGSLVALPDAVNGGNGTTLLAASSQVARSTDGGATWQITLTDTAGLPASHSRIVERFVPAVGVAGLVYLKTNVILNVLPRPLVDGSEVFRSRDGGATWSLIDSQSTALALDPHHPDLLYRLDPRGLYLSSDQGDTWSRLADSPGGDFPVAGLWVDPGEPGAPDRIFTITGLSVLWSDNRGATWHPAQAGLAQINVLWSLQGDPKTPHLLFVGTFNLMLSATF